MWTAFDEAVNRAFKDGSGSLELHTAARHACQDPLTFDNILLGILAAATQKEVWAEAIERAKTSYTTYRAR